MKTKLQTACYSTLLALAYLLGSAAGPPSGGQLRAEVEEARVTLHVLPDSRDLTTTHGPVSF